VLAFASFALFWASQPMLLVPLMATMKADMALSTRNQMPTPTKQTPGIVLID
jgi:hypothetical protein